MLSFGELLGQTAPTALLRRMLATGRVPHALVFQGPEGVGKSTAARLFAAALLCDGTAAEAPCARCASCRQVDHGGHPDLQLVERLPKGKEREDGEDDDDDGADEGALRSVIIIEQIRRITALAALSPHQGRRRVFVIDPADQMNPEAQNALLKTLEEPPGHALLILVAARPHLLLPTVRSRCFKVGFAAMPVADLARALEARGLPADQALARAALAEGRPGRALTLDTAERLARRGELLAMLEQLAGDPRALAQLGAMAADLAGRDAAALLDGLELLAGLLHDAGRSGLAAEPRALIHPDLRPRLARVGQRLGPLRIAALIESLERLRRDLRSNVNRTLAAESLLAAVSGGPLP